MPEETPQRIEPARLEEPSQEINDVVADLSAATAKLGHALNPRTSANLAALVRIMKVTTPSRFGTSLRLKPRRGPSRFGFPAKP
jgi:hypothetical protein